MKAHLLTTTAVLAVVVLNNLSVAQCNPTGATAPTNAVNDQSLALGLVPITNLGNGNVSDDSYAEAAAVTLGDTTQYLLSNDFEFNIPTNATICGIEVSVERSASGLLHQVKDFSVQLSKGGTIGGDDKASATVWPDSDGTVTYGGSSDLWGRTWTPADINDSAFGIAHAVDLSGVSVLPTAKFDNVSINIFYSTPLPITLLYFAGARYGDAIEFEWATASEINNEHFEIQMSTDGESWSTVSSIPGAGNSQNKLNYQTRLPNDREEDSYFRLVQIDFDGQSSSSDVIRIRGMKHQPNKISVNINEGYLIVNTEKAIDEIQLYNQEGRLIFERKLPTTQKTMVFPLRAGQLNAGVFLIRTANSTGQQDVVRVYL